MEYAIGATHVTNGPALVSSVMGDTPLYHASRSLWENITDSGRARTPPSSSAPPPSHRFGHALHSCLGSEVIHCFPISSTGPVSSIVDSIIEISFAFTGQDFQIIVCVTTL